MTNSELTLWFSSESENLSLTILHQTTNTGSELYRRQIQLGFADSELYRWQIQTWSWNGSVWKGWSCLLCSLWFNLRYCSASWNLFKYQKILFKILKFVQILKDIVNHFEMFEISKDPSGKFSKTLFHFVCWEKRPMFAYLKFKRAQFWDLSFLFIFKCHLFTHPANFKCCQMCAIQFDTIWYNLIQFYFIWDPLRMICPFEILKKKLTSIKS